MNERAESDMVPLRHTFCVVAFFQIEAGGNFVERHKSFGVDFRRLGSQKHGS
jgi:hypothetical protein